MPPLEPDLERRIIEYGTTAEDFGPRLDPSATPAALLDLGLPWPAGKAPSPRAINPEPDREDPLPNADVLVVTWTVAEVEALADVLTPGIGRNSWYRYARRFATHYKPIIRNGAPAHAANRLGSYYRTDIAGKKLVLFKSELHLNQDAIRTGPGTATLPVKDLFRQMIDEVKPSLVITVGTAGATFPPDRTITIGGQQCPAHELGDVMITRGAKFRLSQEFANEPFANQSYRSVFPIPTARLEDAKPLLAFHANKLREPKLGPPSTKYNWPLPDLIPGHPNKPDLRIDGRDFPEFHPILTTDFFEFGTSTNGLEQRGLRGRDGRRGPRDGGQGNAGRRPGRAEVARHPQRFRSADQRQAAGPQRQHDRTIDAEQARHASPLGRLVLRELRLLDQRQQRDRGLGNGGVMPSPEPPKLPPEVAAFSTPAATNAAADAFEPLDAAAPSAPALVLFGKVVTMTGSVVNDGAVYLSKGNINAVLRRGNSAPAGFQNAKEVETGGSSIRGSSICTTISPTTSCRYGTPGARSRTARNG